MMCLLRVEVRLALPRRMVVAWQHRTECRYKDQEDSNQTDNKRCTDQNNCLGLFHRCKH
jgi:hypothetical protein